MTRTRSHSILLMLAAFAFVSYLLRSNISVGAEFMMPDLGLSKIEMGQIFTSFLIGYGIFQIPGGMLGDRIGPKLTLGISVLVWGICTILTGFVSRAHAPFTWLWCVRFVLGMAEATTYPVGARVVYNWIEPRKRAFATSLMLTGTSLGAAVAPPLMSWLMLRVGWHAAFWAMSVPAFAAALIWGVFAADKPGVSASEPISFKELKDVMSSRRVILLCLSYVSEGYVLFIFVFWLYIYLVEVRGFGVLKGGLVAVLPWIAGLLFTPVGGFFSDRLAQSRTRLAGAKYVVITGYSASGLLLFAAAYAPGRLLCIASLCLSVGFLMGAEAPFWACATYLSGKHAGAVSGLMNTAGIIGGIISTSLTPVLVAHFGWLIALSSGTAMALGCSLLWLAIGSERTPGKTSSLVSAAHI